MRIALLLLPLLAVAQSQPQFWRVAPVGGAFPAQSDLVLALDARTITGLADGDRVTGNTWTDFWRTHTSSTPGTAPVYRVSGINGRPGVEFLKSDSREIRIADAADLRLQMPYACWFVWKDSMRPSANGQAVVAKGLFDWLFGFDSSFHPYIYNVVGGSSYTAWMGDTHIYGFEVWVDATSNKSQVAYFRDSAVPMEIARNTTNTQPSTSASTMYLGTGSNAGNGASGTMGALYIWKRSAAAADGTGVLGIAERERLVRRLAQDWGLRAAQSALDPNNAYWSQSGAVPVSMITTTAQRTTAMPASPLGLTAWNRQPGNPCCADQTSALIQPYILDTVTGIGGYRYLLIASAYPNGANTEENTLWGSNTPDNTAANWTKIKEDVCGLGQAVNWCTDPWMSYENGTLYVVMPIYGGASYSPGKWAYRSTTDLVNWGPLTPISSGWFGAGNGDYISPSFTYDSATDRWTLWSGDGNNTTSIHRRVGPVGVHWTAVPDWHAVTDTPARIVNQQSDVTAGVNHVLIYKEDSIFYALVFSSLGTQQVMLGISRDGGQTFSMGRLNLGWASTQAWCVTGQYRAAMTRYSAGQWLVAASCGGTAGEARVYLTTMYMPWGE